MNDKAPQMMDASMPEGKGGVRANRPRKVYAMSTLIAEVEALFPETTYEVSNYNRFNAALSVQFDTRSPGMELLLSLIEDDIRVEEVLADDGQVLVTFRDNPRTMDNRDPFNLASAWKILTETDVATGVLYIPETIDLPSGSFMSTEPGAPAVARGPYYGSTFEGGSAVDTSDDETDGGSA